MRHLNISESKYSWYDHCVSERTLVVILLKLYFDNLKIDKYNQFFNKFILTHQNYLKDPKNHIFGNHGLIVDRSLYLVTKILDNDTDKSYINMAKDRMQKLFSVAFSENGINVENSVSYHIFNLDLFLLIEKYIFKYYGDNISDEFDIKIEKAIKYIAIITQPNGKSPNIGD